MTNSDGARGWLVVAGASAGVACGATVLIPYTFGYLTAPLAAQNGWERSDIAPIISAYTFALVLLLPFAGRLIDRIGARNAALAAILAMSATFALLSTIADSIPGLLTGYLIMAVAAVCASPVSYTKAVTSWFDKNRGLALGIALSGVGIGTALWPQIVRALMESGGWQAGYLGLAAILAFVAAPLTWLLVRERPQEGEVHRAHTLTASALRGALARREFWLMSVSFILLGLAMSGVVPLLPSFLHDRGADPNLAIQIQGVLGISAIIGRLFGGWLMDRIHAPYVTVIASVCAAAGLALLGQVDTWGLAAILVGISLGFATGMEGDVIAYLSSRYFPPTIFSTIVGVMVASYLVGAALGPLVVAFGERALGSGVFLILIALLGIASALQLTLGRYARPAAAA